MVVKFSLEISLLEFSYYSLPKSIKVPKYSIIILRLNNESEFLLTYLNNSEIQRSSPDFDLWHPTELFETVHEADENVNLYGKPCQNLLKLILTGDYVK